MRIGVRAHDFGRHSPKQLAQILTDAGYNAAQIVMPKVFDGIENYRDITHTQLSEIREALHEADLQISVLGCYMDLSHPDESIRMEAIENIKRCLSYAKELGAVAVASETSYEHLSKEEKRVRRQDMIDSIQRIVCCAEEECIDFAIEPVEWHPLDSIEEVQAVLRAVNYSSRLKVLFDAANVITPSEVEKQDEVWKAWLTAFGDRMIALHIKDFVWDEKGVYCPTALGAGVMDYSVISQWIQTKPDGMPLIREETIHECALEDLAYLKKLTGND